MIIKKTFKILTGKYIILSGSKIEKLQNSKVYYM